MKMGPQSGEFIRRSCMLAMLILAGAGGGGLAQTAAQQASVPQTPVAPPPPKDITGAHMPPTAGTELDRVVAIVNGELVLDSDVDEERRLHAFEPYRDPRAAFGREQAIERLINRVLILQQLKLQPEDQVSDADVQKQVDELRKAIPVCKRYDCATQAGWDRFLADNGFTEATFNLRWKQRMEVLQFIEDRFRMGIKITPADVSDYYEKTLVPEYRGTNATAPKLSEISDRIQEVLLQRQISGLLSDWLKSLRVQGSVVVLHPGEEAP